MQGLVVLSVSCPTKHLHFNLIKRQRLHVRSLRVFSICFVKLQKRHLPLLSSIVGQCLKASREVAVATAALNVFSSYTWTL